MKITLSKNKLLKELQLLGGVIQMNHPMPIMENFLFEITEGVLKITASDLESTISSQMDVESDGNGIYAINSKVILDILKTLQEQPLALSFSDNNTFEITSSTGNYVMAYGGAEDYPNTFVLEGPTTITLPSGVLSEAISKTIFATAIDDLGPAITGVFFRLSTENLIFVATDAHKLVKYTRDDISASQTAEFIMPKKPLNLLKSILGGSEDDVIIEYNESNAKFSFDNTEMICRLIDGKYPNYEAVIPKYNPNRLIVDRIQLLNAVSCVSVCSNRQAQQVILNISGDHLKITAQDVDYSKRAEERLVCDYQGEDMSIGFNSRYLTEMLRNTDSKDVSIELSSPSRPGILTPSGDTKEGEDVLMLISPSLID